MRLQNYKLTNISQMNSSESTKRTLRKHYNALHHGMVVTFLPRVLTGRGFDYKCSGCGIHLGAK